MAIQQRAAVPPTVVDTKGRRVRVEHPLVPTMERTVLTQDPDGRRALLDSLEPEQRLELSSLTDDDRDDLEALQQHMLAQEAADAATLAALADLSPDDLAVLQQLAALPEAELEDLLTAPPSAPESSG